MNELGKKFRNKIRQIRSTVRYGFVRTDRGDYLILMIWKFGKPIWSKHFKIAEVDLNEGIRNDRYDKKADEFFKSSSK